MIRLVRATKKDLMLLASILIKAFRKTGVSYSVSIARKRLLKGLSCDPRTCFAIRLQTKTVGLLFGQTIYWKKSKVLSIDEFAILPKYQHQGIGSEAFKLLEKWRRKKKYDWIELTTKKNGKAYKFYNKNGFTDAGYIMLWNRRKKPQT